MSKNVVYVTPDYTLEECLYVMNEMKIRNLPVLDEDTKELLTLLTLNQITSIFTNEREFAIQELTRFVSGTNGSTHEQEESLTISKNILSFNIKSFFPIKLQPIPI